MNPTSSRAGTPSGMVLTGTRILVTAQRRASDLALALARRGAEVDVAATLGVQSHFDEETLLARTRAVIASPPDLVVITTGIGFRGWWETAEAADLTEDLHAALAQVRLVARGPKARGALQTVGLIADWVAESETSAEIGEFLRAEGVQGSRIVIQHHGAGDDGLEDVLVEGGAHVTSLVIYRWGPPPDPAAVERAVLDTASGAYDAVAFTSAPGASAWLSVVDQHGAKDATLSLHRAGRLSLAAVGPVTAEPLLRAGFIPLVPDRGRLGALVRAMIVHLGHEGGGVPTPAGRLRVHATSVTIDHELVPLSPTGVCVMRRLCADPGAVVSRGEILTALPGESVDPHNAEVAIARVRDAIGPGAPIRTVVKRGYRLDVLDTRLDPGLDPGATR